MKELQHYVYLSRSGFDHFCCMIERTQLNLASLWLLSGLDWYPPKLKTRVRKLTMRLELIVVDFGGVLHPLLVLPTAILVVQARVVERYCRGRRLLHGSAPGPQLSAPHSTLCGENKLSLPLPPHNTYTTLPMRQMLKPYQQ